MGDMLSTGVSGLLAFQSSLDTISHNISNASTKGYSRQTTNLVTNLAGVGSAGWTGSGVSVASITRSYDTILAGQTRDATSGYNQLNTVSMLAGSVSNLLGDPTTGLSATLTGFTNAVQGLANSPDSTAARQAVLSQAQKLIAQFKSYENGLQQIDTQVNSNIAAETGTVTSLGQSIANLNQQIIAATNQTGQPPNDLLDQRDNLIDQLSTHVSVNAVKQSDGSVNVFIGSGQPLVAGTSAMTLAAVPDPYNSGQSRLVLQSGAVSADVTNAISGGSLGGYLQVQNQMLTPAHNALGQAAVTLATLVNQQNSAGLDQNGDVGADLMTVGAPDVKTNSRNQGTESVSASVTDLGGLTTANYHLGFDGTNWNLTDTASGAVTALTTSTVGTTTKLTGAGMTLVVNDPGTTKTAGDRFLIRPTAAAVSGMSLVTSDATRVAAAGPVVTSAGSANSGTAAISSATVPNTSAGSWTRGNYTITFSGASNYTIAGRRLDGSAYSSSGAYTAGSPINFNGIDVNLTGTPAAGDTFAINDNGNGTGDNSNALKLAAIANQKVLTGGRQSLSGVITAYIGTVGLQTSQAQAGATAQQTVMQSAQSAQQSVSGVNLDEEAANMVKFEQAYEAAAQVIKTAATLFQSLLAAVHG